MRVLVATMLAWCLGCHGEQELRDDCPTAGTDCPACQDDRDCVIVSNSCHDTAVCTSADRDPPLAVTQEGCGSWAEYDVPPVVP